ncbi:MAG: hypothetical protein CSB33_01050 [Desulfobacterales bacterium]|nr:MAG: hypothetical protein CSB33_01050 [Desulfobacterales bacterium]
MALLHYPVLNKQGEVIASSVTNLDLHDIARAARTFGVHRFFVVTPLADQQELVREITGHWETGSGARYNPDRRSALRTIRLADTLEDVAAAIREPEAQSPEPMIIATTASMEACCRDRVMTVRRCRELLDDGRRILLCFGTAWGLAPEFMDGADAILSPIQGPGAYNHLSVRSAAAILLDRLLAG